MKTITLTPIGTVRSTRKEASDDNWDSEHVHIELDTAQYSNEALMGLADYSHVEVIFYMDKVDPARIERVARHPRNNPEWPKVGIFAQRGKARPNQLGATVCRITKVDGTTLYLEGLDAIEGTPVLDLKPWVAEYALRGSVFQPQWVTELMTRYWKT